MSDQDDNGTIFNSDPQQTKQEGQAPDAAESVDNQQGQNGFEDLLASITAPDGRQKYNSVEDALKSLQHSQSHISTLEQEMQELRSQFQQTQQKAEELETKSKTMEELVSEFKAGQQNSTEKPSNTQSVDPEFIENTVESLLTRRQQVEAANKNIGTVINAFKEKYGEEKAEEVFYSRAQELGLGREFVNSLAAQSPKAVFGLYGIEDSPKRTDNISSSSVNTEAVEPKTEQVSGKVKIGATTKDMTDAWRAIGRSLNNE